MTIPEVNKIYVGDCVNIMRSWPDKSIGAVVTDRSGTTLIAAERTGRSWIGIEIEPKYKAVIERRIEKERSQLKLAL